MSDTAPVFLITPRGRFELKRGETLLAALERTGHTVEYQCRSGYCGSCRVKMKKGKVFYKEPPLAFLNPNEILLCCCQVEQDLEIEL